MNKTNILEIIPVSTELLKVTAHVELNHLDLNGDYILDPPPGILGEVSPDFIYEMALIDWNDKNGDETLNDTDYEEMNT